MVQITACGISRWTFIKKITHLLDGMLSYSFMPIRVMSLAGALFSFLGFVYAGFILVDTLFLGNPVKGWAPLMIMVLVIGGFQMIMLGVIGEYLWRTLAQVRRRDMYLVDAVYKSETPRVPRTARWRRILEFMPGRAGRIRAERESAQNGMKEFLSRLGQHP